MSATESTMRPSGSPKPRSATRNGETETGCGGRPRMIRTSSAHTNLASEIDEPGNPCRRSRHAAQMTHAGNLAQLLERRAVDFLSKIETKIRHPVGFGLRLRFVLALVTIDGGEDSLGIHMAVFYSLNSLILVLN